jgi:hypothetical protein
MLVASAMFNAGQLRADQARLKRKLLYASKGDSPEVKHALGRALVWLAPSIEHWGETDADYQARLDHMAIIYCDTALRLIRKAGKLTRRGGRNPRHGTVATEAYMTLSPESSRVCVRPYAHAFAQRALTPARLNRLNLWNPMPEWEAFLDTGSTTRNWLEI